MPEYILANVAPFIRLPPLVPLDDAGRNNNLFDVLFFRNHQDRVVVYPRPYFMDWWNHNEVNEEEHGGYLRPRIEMYQRLYRGLGNVPLEAMTPQWKAHVCQQWWIGNCEEPRNRLEAEACIDLPTLERVGIIQADLNREDAQTILNSSTVGTWLLRRSAANNGEGILPEAELFSFSGRGDESVVNYRWVHVHGVGFYAWKQGDSLESFLDLASFEDPETYQIHLRSPTWTSVLSLLGALLNKWHPRNCLLCRH